MEKKLTKVQYAMKADRYVKNASNPVLPQEAKIMKFLRNKGVDAIPTVHHFGQETASDGKTMMNIMIMDLLGKSIQDNFEQAGYRCDLETVLNFGIQGLEILGKIHALGVVYRDIKPENFCLSAKANSSGQHKVQIVDFGLAKHYMVK